MGFTWVWGCNRDCSRSGSARLGRDLLCWKFIKKSHQKQMPLAAARLLASHFPFSCCRRCFPWSLHIYDDWQIKNANKFQFLTCRRHTLGGGVGGGHTHNMTVTITVGKWGHQAAVGKCHKSCRDRERNEDEMQTSGYPARPPYAYLWKVQSGLVKSSGMSWCCIVIK